jgi:hypothetical protein
MENNSLRKRAMQSVPPLTEGDIRNYVDQIMDRLKRGHGPAVVKVWLSKGPQDAVTD